MLDDKGTEHNGKSWADVGDYVLFAKYAGRNINDPFTPDEEDLIVLNDEDVLAVITPMQQVIPESLVREAALLEE
jgi:co-chaperonin GroES (HSP10)